MQKLLISATGHSLNYLPQYIAEANGFFKDVGLEVSSVVPRPWDRVLDDIASGEAFAALGGVWVPSMYHERGRRLVPFAQVAARAPLALIGRKPQAVFDLSSLPGKVVAMKGSNGASVGVYLKMLLREAGIDPKSVNYIQDLDAGILCQCFAGGMADFLLIDLPAALTFEAQGHGHVVAKFAVTGGPVPWSVYYTDGAVKPVGDDPRARFSAALKKGMDWVNANEASSFKPVLAKLFPSLDPEIAVSVVNLYREHEMWTTPRIELNGYERWQKGIADAHLVDKPIDDAALIDSGPAKDL